MHTWHWHSWNGLPYLTCSLLESWQHGFFTQQFSPRPPAELTALLHPTAPSYRLTQVHGNTVLVPSEVEAAIAATNSPPNADALVTEAAEQSVWVCSADCTPALIADVVTGQVAAIHAGWRGTSLKILPQAIARLQAQGSRLEDLRVALGPAIAGERYQVSEQVAAEVGATIVPQGETTDILTAVQQLPDSPISTDSEPGRMRLDVRRVNAIQLEQLGICPDQVAIAPFCTYHDSEHFFSYRRIRQKRAQWSGIVSA